MKKGNVFKIDSPLEKKGMPILDLIERYSKRRGHKKDVCRETMSYIMLSGFMREDMFWNCFAPMLDELVIKGVKKV